ncbi:MAG: hypothetical protein HYX61_08655 [Gammaproteobacteria bacterium]|jgi:hypothetical protein|nr:hypothetical protein [Gammaproteobacteria bacterium]
MLEPHFPKQKLQDDLKNVQIIGSIKLIKNRFKLLSTSAKMHFLAGWLNNTVNSRLNPNIAALDENEKPIVKRMHQIWRQMLLNIGDNMPSTPISDFRRMMEKDVIAQLAHENLTTSIPTREKLAYYRQLLSIISKGNQVTAPDPQLVKTVRSKVDQQRVLYLQSFKSRFTEFSISLQQKALKLLSRPRLNSRSFFSLWVQKIRNQFSALKNDNAKESFIDDLTSIHQKKLVDILVERQRKALYMRWTASVPKAKPKPKQIVGRCLFLPAEPVIDLTKDASECGKRKALFDF